MCRLLLAGRILRCVPNWGSVFIGWSIPELDTTLEAVPHPNSEGGCRQVLVRKGNLGQVWRESYREQESYTCTNKSHQRQHHVGSILCSRVDFGRRCSCTSQECSLIWGLVNIERERFQSLGSRSGERRFSCLIGSSLHDMRA